MMNPRVTELIPELSASVEKIMSPLTSPDERQMAHEVIQSSESKQFARITGLEVMVFE